MSEEALLWNQFYFVNSIKGQTMTKKKVIVKGGGENLYYVSETYGIFYVYKGHVWDSDTLIGKARSMSEALTMISRYSGRDIESAG